MARQKRSVSEQKEYHIVLKGINAGTIFFDDNDYNSFLKYFKQACVDYDIELQAYCIMNNHAHFLLKINNDNMSDMFKSFGATYVPKYNANHSKVGPLFNGRYYSSPINDEGYLLAVLRYIHYNPVKAGICRSLDEYKWSSYNDYFEDRRGITDTGFIKGLFSEDDLKKLHIIDDNLLDEAFILDSRINGVDESEVRNYIDANQHRKTEELIEILKEAKMSKRAIANVLNINRKHIR